MPSHEHDETKIYKVIISEEEQYSIWPEDREIPPGWRAEGKTGTKAECLEHMQYVWTDMRARSLREKMEEAERRRNSGEA